MIFHYVLYSLSTIFQLCLGKQLCDWSGERKFNELSSSFPKSPAFKRLHHPRGDADVLTKFRNAPVTTKIKSKFLWNATQYIMQPCLYIRSILPHYYWRLEMKLAIPRSKVILYPITQLKPIAFWVMARLKSENTKCLWRPPLSRKVYIPHFLGSTQFCWKYFRYLTGGDAAVLWGQGGFVSESM